jgi:sensor histidine kinase YesM
MTVVLEPFPMFVDYAPPEHVNYFSNSKMSYSIHMLSPSNRPRKPRISVPTKLSNYLRLRYHQYEVTFGLYMMTPAEKLVLNTIILVILSALFYALYLGLEPFVVRTICRLIYYNTGSYKTAAEFCNQ